MRTDLYTVAAEDAAVKREGVADQVAFGHHQRTSRATLDTRPAGDAVCIVQAHIKWCRDDGIEALAEHAVAIRADHIMADTHALRAVDALVGVAQDETMRQVQVIVVIVARFAIMETIISQTMFDAVHLQITLPGGRTGTLETTSGLAFGLLLEIP